MITHKAKASLAAALLTLTALPAQAQDWTGAYIGASASSHSGSNTEFHNGAKTSPDDYDNPYTRKGTMRSLFAGYRIQNDTLVYGAEISRSTGALRMPEPYRENNISDYSTLMGKIGYAQGKALVSIGLGYFKGTMTPKCVAVCGDAELSGLAVSLGVDYLVAEKLTIGVAITRRKFGKSPFSKLPDYETSGNDDAIEFRIGYNF